MTIFERAESTAEYYYRVSGMPDLPEVRNPNSPHFKPDHVTVMLRNGVVERMVVSGPKYGAAGKLLKQRGFTAFDVDDLNADPADVLPGDEVPDGLREILAEVMTNPFAVKESA
jgi:hypothetical protein